MKTIKSLIFVLFLNGLWLNAQTLTIDNSGNTGTSGSNWSTSGTNPATITVTGAAHINTSVITGYLNAGTDVVISTTVDGLIININAAINAGAGTGNLTFENISSVPFTNVYIYYNANLTLGGNLTLDVSSQYLHVYLSAGVYLNIAGDLTLDDARVYLRLYSNSTAFSSLIVAGDISGAGGLSYERWSNPTPGNDLLSSPFGATTWGEIWENESWKLVSGFIGDVRHYLFGPYNESVNTYGDLYNWDTSGATPLPAGTGYRVGTTSAGDMINFQPSPWGSLDAYNNAHRSTVNVPLTNTGEGWNLVGNPYPSYLSLSQVLSTNTASLYGGAYTAFYTYNGNATNPWTIYNESTGTDVKIAPGQAFFVRAAEGGGSNFSFTPSMQSNTGGDDFIAGRSSTSLDEVYYTGINLSSGSSHYSTQLYFHPNGSTGLDVGYDAANWQNSIPDFGIYSHLVEQNQGLALAIQTLNTTALAERSVLIPLGIESEPGLDLEISLLEDLNLPLGSALYLEDRELGVFTNLRSSVYSINSQEGFSGTGRFYLHLGSDASLSNTKEAYAGLQVYAPSGSEALVVAGITESGMELTLYDMLGRTLLQHKLSNESLQPIAVGHLSAGPVVVLLRGSHGSRSLKVIINH